MKLIDLMLLETKIVKSESRIKLSLKEATELRVNELKKSLREDKIVFNFDDPKFNLLLTKWEEYLAMDKESIKHYDELKKYFIDFFSEKWFYEYLNTTRFFNQTRYILKNGIKSEYRFIK